MRWRDDTGELEEVSAYMQALASAPLDASPLPDPSLVWWKGQLLRRWDAERQADAAIDVGERVQVAIGVAGALLLLVWMWESGRGAFSASTSTMVLVGAAVLATVASLTVWRVIARD